MSVRTSTTRDKVSDDRAALEVARDDYARIKTDSPWRWVPVFVGPLGFLAIGVAFDTGFGSLPSLVACGAWLALFLLLRVSRAKDGLADAFRIAVRRARATGGTRLNSRPWFARAMLVAGVAMVVTWIVVHTTPIGNESVHPTVMLVFRSLGFVMFGVMLVVIGWARPWDLKVVERGTIARE